MYEFPLGFFPLKAWIILKVIMYEGGCNKMIGITNQKKTLSI